MLARRLPPGLIPAVIANVDAMPMTGTGKVHKLTLRQQFRDHVLPTRRRTSVFAPTAYTTLSPPHPPLSDCVELVVSVLHVFVASCNTTPLLPVWTTGAVVLNRLQVGADILRQAF